MVADARSEWRYEASPGGLAAMERFVTVQIAGLDVLYLDRFMAEPAISLSPCPFCHQHHGATELTCPMSGEVLPLQGRVLAKKFRLLKKLGEGGMSTVWQAENTLIKKEVAIKLMLPELAGNAATLQRFRNEATSAGRIGSAHICDILDFGQSQAGPFIVMELLRGRDLARLLEERGKLHPGLAAALVRQALVGLGAAHRAGIIHRDLKPENLFLHEPEPGRVVVKLMDFGISKFTEIAVTNKTATGVLMGTPAYMAPEQVEGAANVDVRTDVWAIGVILYYALTGKEPFRGESLASLLMAVATTEPPPPSLVDAEIPEKLSEVVMRCLLKAPSQRFQDCEELLTALQPFAQDDRLAEIAQAKWFKADTLSTEDSGGVSKMDSGPGPVASTMAYGAPGPLGPGLEQLPNLSSQPSPGKGVEVAADVEDKPSLAGVVVKTPANLDRMAELPGNGGVDRPVPETPGGAASDSKPGAATNWGEDFGRGLAAKPDTKTGNWSEEFSGQAAGDTHKTKWSMGEASASGGQRTQWEIGAAEAGHKTQWSMGGPGQAQDAGPNYSSWGEGRPKSHGRSRSGLWISLGLLALIVVGGGFAVYKLLIEEPSLLAQGEAKAGEENKADGGDKPGSPGDQAPGDPQTEPKKPAVPKNPAQDPAQDPPQDRPQDKPQDKPKDPPRDKPVEKPAEEAATPQPSTELPDKYPGGGGKAGQPGAKPKKPAKSRPKRPQRPKSQPKTHPSEKVETVDLSKVNRMGSTYVPKGQPKSLDHGGASAYCASLRRSRYAGLREWQLPSTSWLMGQIGKLAPTRYWSKSRGTQTAKAADLGFGRKIVEDSPSKKYRALCVARR